MAAKAVGLEGAKYKAWVKRRTRKPSCAELTDAQLQALVDWLKPTRAQWRKVGDLIREIGMSGFEDDGFKTFVQRVTKETDPRLLSRMQVRQLIAGLVGWTNHRRKTGATTPPAPTPNTGAPVDDDPPAEGRIPHDPKEKAPSGTSGRGL
jgi:hypothetical protein